MRFKCPHSWTIEQRIAHRTRRDPLSGCWIWQGATQRRQGYGTVGYGDRTWLAHRLAWTGRHGPIPAGKILCHRCDERRCVNPDHLFLGDWRLNMADLKAKRLRRATAAATDTGRIHIFIRGQELVGDVTWEIEHEQPDHRPTGRGVHCRADTRTHPPLHPRRKALRRLQRRRGQQPLGRNAA
jgi:hypothetical protein